MACTDLRSEGKAGRSRGQITADVRERERRAVELVRLGRDYAQIAEELGYSTESGARLAVKRALARVAEPEVEKLREIETTRLVDLMRRCYELLEQDHVVVSHGRVVRDPVTGEPLRDHAAVVAIIREIRQLSAELSKLRGLHAPQRVVVEEITEDVVQAEIRRITAMADKVVEDLVSMGVDVSDLVIDADKEEDGGRIPPSPELGSG